MSRMRPLKAREVARVLHGLGYAEMPKRGKGAHRVFRHPSGRFTTVQIPIGTLRAILADLGLAWEELEALL